MADYHGTSGADNIDQTLLALPDYTVIYGDGGNDTISIGNATAIGGTGNDTIVGRTTNSTVAYWNSASGVTVNLATGVANDGLGGTDAINGVRNVQGSSWNDTLIGSAADETFQGGGGSNTIIGGAGYDVAYYYFQSSKNATITYNSATDTFTVTKNFPDGDRGVDTLTGIEEIRFSGSGSDEVSYSRSSFTGNFRQQPTSIALGLAGSGVSIVSIATGDFNGDGSADILLVEQQGLGTTPEPAIVMTGDGHGNFLNSTSSIFASGSFLNQVGGGRTYVSDLNNDGISDIFQLNYGIDNSLTDSNTNAVALSNSVTHKLDNTSSSLTSGAAQNHGAVVGDFTGDGYADVVVETLDHGVRYLVNDGHGAFVEKTTAFLPPSIKGAPAGAYLTAGAIDANGDGKLDLILNHADAPSGPASFVLLNPGNGDFSGVTPIALPASGVSNEIVLDAKSIDLNGDGLPDMVRSVTSGPWQTPDYYATPYIQLLINDGGGHFHDATSSYMPQPLAGTTGWYKLLTVADFNRDGYSDVLGWLSPGPDTGPSPYLGIVFLNNGNGTFSVAQTFLGSPTALDANSDGMIDIATVTDGGTLTININAMANQHIYKAEFGQASIAGSAGNDAMSDRSGNTAFAGGPGNDALNGGSGNDTLDGGGGSDKAIYSGNYASYAIVHNPGGSVTVTGSDGTDTLRHIEQLVFSDRTVAIGTVPWSDFNDDASSDFVWQNTNGQAGVWLLNGAGVLSAAAVGANPGPTWHIKGSGDFDGDGKADILWQNDSGQAQIWLMNGTAVANTGLAGNNPGPGWHVKSSGDFDGDGRSDILWQNDSGQAAIWLMNGTTVTSGPLVGNNPGPSWHIRGSGDFDGNGKSDILWQDDTGQAAVWLMNGTSITSSGLAGGNPGTSWHIAGTGDFNGDFQSDILWQNDSGQAAIWLMNGATVLSGTTVGSNLGTSWHVKGAADVDGDGKSDILWQNDSGQAQVWLMNGTNVLSSSLVGGNPGASWQIANNGTTSTAPKVRGDFDGDKMSDLLLQNDSGQAAIWLMNGTTVTSTPLVGNNPGTSWHVKGSADFNGDGKADILWQDDSGQAAVWLMNGSTVTSGPLVGNNPGPSWHVRGTGDFDGDGKADILWQNDAGQTAIWMLNGTSITSGPLAGGAVSADWHIKGTGDFDGDGKTDILWQNDSGQAAIWLMNGASIKSGPLAGGNPGASWHVKGAGDFDGDGKADILWQNDSGQAGIWLMDGASVASATSVGGNPGTSWKVIGAADVNDDGLSDILWQNTNGQAAAWTMSGTSLLSTLNLGQNQGSAWHLIATSV